MKLITLLLALLVIAPAVYAADETPVPATEIPSADSKVIDTQYYTYLRDTCQKNNVERAWNRWFGDKQKDLNVDQCCMDSIAAMEKSRSLATKDGNCPDGTEKKSLECPTSKMWCEKKAP
jgi:hypothetical protein